MAVQYGRPEVIVVAQRWIGGEQTIIGDRYGIPMIRQVGRYAAPRIQTNVTRYGALRLQDVT